jgi:hypothetical protein
MEKGKVFYVDKLTYGKDFYVLPPKETHNWRRVYYGRVNL